VPPAGLREGFREFAEEQTAERAPACMQGLKSRRFLGLTGSHDLVAASSRAQLRMPVMPLGGLFVGMGQRENRRLRERGAADLQTDR
jgi:hypothetical protein